MYNLDPDPDYEPVIVQVTNCPMCGKTHYIEFRRLYILVVKDYKDYEYVGRCGSKFTLVQQATLEAFL